MSSYMTSQPSGPQNFLGAWQLISQAQLRRFVVFPLLCNLILFAALFFATIHWIHELNQWLTHLLPTWLSWLTVLVWPLFFIAFFMVIFYTFTLVANLIASPFNALLSEKVQTYLTGKTIDNRRFLEVLLKETPKALLRQCQFIGYYLPRAFLCLLLFFIPIVQIAAPFVWFFFNAWMMSLQYLDYPMDNNKISFADMRQQLRDQTGITLSFGMTVNIATLIPVVNFFVMPMAVVGATSLWVSQFKKTI